MTDRNHHHNGLNCREGWSLCPGGCIDHLQDEGHTTKCANYIAADRFNEALEAPDHSLENRLYVRTANDNPLREDRHASPSAAPFGFKGTRRNPFERTTGLTTFEMFRGADESGVSGTGRVLEGVIFTDGTVVVRWCTANAPASTVVYAQWSDFMGIHVRSHADNDTVIRFSDGRVWRQGDDKIVFPSIDFRPPHDVDWNKRY